MFACSETVLLCPALALVDLTRGAGVADALCESNSGFPPEPREGIADMLTESSGDIEKIRGAPARILDRERS